MKRSIFSILVIASAAILSSCGKPAVDMHAAPRETKAYEAVDAATLGKPELLTHLSVLITEINAATTASETLEFHHLESALTPTLEALEKIAVVENDTGNMAAITSLKPLAIQLHVAGHDSNAVMGTKLASAIEKLAAQLLPE